ncbi:MAG TPA: hypothetical protein VK988_10215 [Acidimicrobiales bacterium]|nr:hypothetical protein [Acidimicrobiales bacterium]
MEGGYLVELHDEREMKASVRVEGGYVVRLRVWAGKGGDAQDVVYEFSHFGSAPGVSAPPADKVTKSPAAPKCPEDGQLPKEQALY